MRIQSINSYNNFKTQNYKSFQKNNTYTTYKSYPLFFWGERVRKDINSFNERNKEYIPKAFREYMNENDCSDLAPMEAIQKAYEGFLISENVQDIKDYYPDEPLFQDLKEVKDTKATKGLLYDIRLMQDTMEQEGESVLKTGENFIRDLRTRPEEVIT